MILMIKLCKLQIGYTRTRKMVASAMSNVRVTSNEIFLKLNLVWNLLDVRN